MKKTNTQTTVTKSAIDEQVEILFDYDLTEKQIEFIESIANKKSFTTADLNALQDLESELMDGKNETPIKKAGGFKWLTFDGFKKLVIENTRFEDIKVGDKIGFHFTKKSLKTMERLNIEYNNDTLMIDAPTKYNFEYDTDYAIVTEIQRDEITCKSTLTDAEYYIYSDNFTTEKQKEKCVTDYGLPFVVYSKIA